MGRGPVSPLLHYLRTIAAVSGVHERSDGELLTCFAENREEAAFAALVRRHGPMVLGICRRLLGHEQDAEDAFQAVFLVLAAKAGSVRRRASVASFLHGVAERVARKARRTLARRRDRVAPLPEVAAPEVVPPLLGRELRLVLDEEVRRLPEPYREVFLLCCIEGRTNAEAARRLGCPKGTVLSRLSRARERLSRRLRRRGITLPAVALTALLSVETLRAAVPPSLAASTVRLGAVLAAEKVLPAGIVSAHILALTTEGVKTMFWMKTTAMLSIVLTGTALTAVVLGQRTTAPPAAAMPQEVAKATDPVEKPAPKPPKEENKRAERDLLEQYYKLLSSNSFERLKEEKKDEKKKDEVKKKDETPLDTLLRKWAEADDKVREEHLQFTRTEKDKVWDVLTVTKGQAYIKKPDFWRVDLRDKDGKMDKVWLLESKRLHICDCEAKIERVYPWPTDAASVHDASGLRVQPPDRSWFSFLFSLKGFETQIRWSTIGVQARDLSPRFEVRLAKEDQFYSYLDIKPRSKEDKKWFRRARVVLNHDGYRVRQLWMEHLNDNEIKVDYLPVRTNPDPPINPEIFLMKRPKGWKHIDLSADKDADK